jgi:hypothetical protein
MMLGIGIGDIRIPPSSGDVFLLEQLSGFSNGAVRLIDFNFSNIFRLVKLLSIQVGTNLKRDRLSFS